MSSKGEESVTFRDLSNLISTLCRTCEKPVVLMIDEVDMSFSQSDIAGMLAEYEQDYETGMDIDEMARLIYEYTSGYPFLVSAICKILDEIIWKNEKSGNRTDAWTREGLLSAVKILLQEKNTLFESLINRLIEYPELKEALHSILFIGGKITFNTDNDVIDIASMFGFVKREQGNLVIANRIFEMRLYNYFLSEEEISSRLYKEGTAEKNRFVQNGAIDMELSKKMAVNSTCKERVYDQF